MTINPNGITSFEIAGEIYLAFTTQSISLRKWYDGFFVDLSSKTPPINTPSNGVKTFKIKDKTYVAFSKTNTKNMLWEFYKGIFIDISLRSPATTNYSK
jgi:hypothetical protein